MKQLPILFSRTYGHGFTYECIKIWLWASSCKKVLITKVNSDGSGKSGHLRSLPRAFAVCSHSIYIRDLRNSRFCVQDSYFWAGTPILHENLSNLHYRTPIFSKTGLWDSYFEMPSEIPVYETRGSFRQRATSLTILSGCICALNGPQNPVKPV